jgi:hypothetical protein
VEEPVGEDDVEALMNSLDPAEKAPAVDSEHLRRIAQLVGTRARIEHDLKDAVRAAHANGESWAQIALALGLSRRAARRLYADRNPHPRAS